MLTVGSVPGDPDGVAVSTTNESIITVWLQCRGPTTMLELVLMTGGPART
jgi:hypothetical protein